MCIRDSSQTIRAVFVNDCLYVGGVLLGSIPDRCRLFEYTLSIDTWDILDTNISEFALASFESKLVLIGGREYNFEHSSGSLLTNKVWVLSEQYELQDTTVPPMNTKRKSAHAVGHGKHLIVAGGGDSEETMMVEVYDSDTKTWFLTQPLPCLLYTSPSPRDATLSRMPSSA